MPILSIIVPTHERAKYAVPTIRSLLESTPDDVEVVVTDTSANDVITSALQHDAGWTRVRMVRPGRPLSVVDNFNEGLRQSTGDYLLFLGDDDFVTPAVADLVRWAVRQSVDAIQLTFPALYYWPDFLHKRRHDFYAGTVQLEPFTGRIESHDAKAALQDAAANLGGGVGQMPRAYAGIVSRALVDRIVARYGALFGGVSPDIYSAALIAQECRHCVRVDYPLIVPGSSGASTAGQSAQGRHVGGLRDNPHIGAFKNLVWDPLVPEFYSVPTVWSFSLLKALEQVKPPVPTQPGRLFARCLFYHRHYFGPIRRSLRHWTTQVGLLRATTGLVAGMVVELGWVTRKVGQMIKARLHPVQGSMLTGQADSIAAARAMHAWLGNTAPALNLAELPRQP
jgi:hypothetical protein